MVHVYEDIHLVKDSYVNVYLIVRGADVVLIDAGLESTWSLIKDYLNTLGLTFKDLTAVVITHHHRDHVGSLKYVVQNSNAVVAAHVDEIELIKSRSGVNVNVALRDGDMFKGLKVVHTPGHTPGHICLLDLKTKSLFVGDLVVEENGELNEIPHHYSIDPMKNREAIKKLRYVDFNNLMPSHGEPLLHVGKEKLEVLITKLV